MKHAIIVGHPDRNSFTQTMAATYEETVARLGHRSVTRNLYELDFDPRLRAEELPTRPNWRVKPDIVEERNVIGDADVFAFLYPLWFNTPPAMVKGYIERVFGAGFGYERPHGPGHGPLLTGRQLIHVTASGSSDAWLNEQGGWMSLCNLFDTYFANLCGMHVHPHIHFDSIVPGLEQRWIETNLKTLEMKLIEYFGPGEGVTRAPGVH